MPFAHVFDAAKRSRRAQRQYTCTAGGGSRDEFMLRP